MASIEKQIRLLLKEADKRILHEAVLSRTEIGKHEWRLEKFIRFIKEQNEFKVGANPPYTDQVISLQLTDLTNGTSHISILKLPQEEEIFRNWVANGKQSGYDFSPYWNNSPHSWSEIYKDKNFQYEIEKSGNIPDKFLTPSNLGLAGIENVTPSMIISAIRQKVADPDLVEILVGLTNAASSADEKIADISNLTNQLSLLSETDKRHIIKDFGEVLAAIMISGMKPGSQISFPASISHPLSDFSLLTPDGTENYSVKSLSGSGSAISNYLKSFSDYAKKEEDPKKKEIAKVLITVASATQHNKVLILANFLKEDAEIFDLMKKIRDAVYPSNLKDNFNDTDLFNAAVGATGGASSAVRKYRASIGNLTSEDRPQINKDSINSAFLYPLLKRILVILNSDPTFKQVIAEAANMMQIIQCYIAFDNIKKPTLVSLKFNEFSNVKPKDVKFMSKGSSNTFKQGSIVVSLGKGSAFTTDVQVEQLIQTLVKEMLKS